MQAFPKATHPTEVITVSLEVTPVASKFSLPTEVVTVNTHCFSPPTWLEGVGGLASLSTNPVLGTTQLSALAGLVAQMVTRSFGMSVPILAKGIIVLPLGAISEDPSRLISAGKVVGSAGGDSSLGCILLMQGWCHLPPGFLQGRAPHPQ